ncbi:AzlD domain-containing protein [Micromonospora sp. NPDC051543]|uniref:AzlD domain-containing protein n=1 Tax=Micromonospora sp. NPDC051543 TaxID=3364287 RepID=UPI003788CBD8
MIVAIVALAAINISFKAIGPAVLGDRLFPAPVQTAVDAMPAALLAGLLVIDLLGQYWQAFDWTLLPGLGLAVALRISGRPHLVCIVAAVAGTSALRVVT